MDPEPVGLRAADLPREAVEDVIAVCAGFHIVNRLADALAFAVPSPERDKRGAPGLYKRGYGFSGPSREGYPALFDALERSVHEGPGELPPKREGRPTTPMTPSSSRVLSSRSCTRPPRPSPIST